MKKINRFKELEKIAKKLEIGKKKKVKCVSCKKEIDFNKAIIITDKEKVTHLCRECNAKLEEGKLVEKKERINNLISKINKLKDKSPKINSPDWTIEPDWKYTPQFDHSITEGTSNIKYTVASIGTTSLSILKLEPDYAY